MEKKFRMSVLECGTSKKECLSIVKDILNNQRLRLVGLHIHRSNIIDMLDYKTHVSYVIDRAMDLQMNFGIHLDYIDIGSGFAIN